MDTPSPRTCPNCSQSIPLESAFCPFCGTRLEAPSAPGQAAPQAQPTLPALQPGVPEQPTLQTQPTMPVEHPAYTYQPAHKPRNWTTVILAISILLLLCCATLIGVGWWQRNRIPYLSGLIGQPTSTVAPRPSSTHRPTSTRRPTLGPVATVAPAFPTQAPVLITAIPAPVRISNLCLLASGSINDGGFNSQAWNGVSAVASQYGAQSTYAEPGYVNPNYSAALDELLPQKCDLIVGVGFLTAEAIQQAALANPEQKFLLLDSTLDMPLPNVWAQAYASDQGAFLAGYLAASVSKTGKVGTFGGYDIPTVRIYMNGFTSGVSYFNSMHNASIQVLGWDINSQTGMFTDDFSDSQQGQVMARQLISQGADVLFPVAGAASAGAAAEATTHTGVYFIGIDEDWAANHPEYANVTLTSVEKRLDASISMAVAGIAANTFQGGEHSGALPTEISLSPYHSLEWLVADAVRAELDQVKADIISSKINPQAVYGPVGREIQPVQLTFWVIDSTLPHLQQWVSSYQQANMGVKVSLIPIPYSDIQAQYQTSVAAGQGPDLLLYSSPQQIQDMARAGQIRPLDDLLAGKLAGISNTALMNVSVDGRVYGVPYSAYSLVLYYNKSLLPNPPSTMDELASLVRQGKKLSLLQSAFFEFPFFTAFGGQLVDGNGRCVADQNSGFSDALQYLQGLSRDGAIISPDWASVSDAFRDGQAAMTINGPWSLSEYQTALGDNLGVAPIPQGSAASASITGGNWLLVNPNSKNAGLAVDLALYLASVDSQAALTPELVPIRTDMQFAYGDPKQVFTWSAITGFPESWLTNNYYTVFESVVTSVLSSGADPAAAVRDACQQMNNLNGK